MSIWKQFEKLEYEDVLEAAIHAKYNKKREHLVSWKTNRDGCLIWRDELVEFLNEHYDFVEADE